MTDRLPCSVVLPTRDRPAKLERALASVKPALAPGDELVVVDSASRDPAVARVAEAGGARVLRCDRPGVNRARNAGWRATSHEALLYVDDDVTVDSDWADEFVAALATHPQAGFVSGWIGVPPDQPDFERPVAVKDELEGAVLTAASTGALGHSASLAIRRSALEQVGGWDEALGAGGRFKSGPEVDLFDRMFAAGWAGWYEPSARAWHDQWRTRGDLVHLDWRYGYGSGARVAKLIRTDRARARQVARDVFWTQGVQDAATQALSGHKTALLRRLAQVSGAGVGLLRALPVPVVDGHYLPGKY